MRKFASWMLLMAVAISASTGCSQNSNMVRGQSPADCPPGACPPGGAPNYGPYGTGSYTGWDKACCCNPDWCVNGMETGPNHRYVEPRYLQYPNQPDMPAVYQYPYYTLKGPDCFFKQ